MHHRPFLLDRLALVCVSVKRDDLDMSEQAIGKRSIHRVLHDVMRYGTDKLLRGCERRKQESEESVTSRYLGKGGG